MLVAGDGDYTEKRSYNIDIEFSDVTYIELPNIFPGISVAKAVTDVPERIISHLVPGNKVFTIGTDSEIYYMIGGGITIGENRWLEETRLINPYLEYEKVLAIF
jgi:hypothetical protein